MTKLNGIPCECCRSTVATIKDYRFIDSIGCQGKILVCKHCFHLSDTAFVEEFTRQL